MAYRLPPRQAVIISVLLLAFCRDSWAQTPVSTDQWVQQLIALKGHKQAAFEVGPELLKLDPDFALKVVETAWPELTDYQVKTGLLKAFHFSKSLRPKKHPHAMKILHLGMSDEDQRVCQYAAAYVKEYALEDFATRRQEYAQWYAEYGHLPPEEIISANQIRRRPLLEAKLREIVDEFTKGDLQSVQTLAREISGFRDPYAIPTLIGIIDADNSYDTVYGIGYFALGMSQGLGSVTGVSFSMFHDGPWWRRWWRENKSRFPQDIQQTPIPDLPKTRHGENYLAYPDNMDSLDGKLQYIPTLLQAGGDVSVLAREIAGHKDPRAIPHMIGLIASDNTHDTVYGVGYWALNELTTVTYDAQHDGDWWEEWWQQHKSEYPPEVQQIPIPDYREFIAVWRNRKKQQDHENAMQDVADVPALDLFANGNQKMRYFLIGAGQDAKTPPQGYNLLVVMPGGPGGAEFHPFVRRIYKNALGEDFIVAQPVAFKWNNAQVIVWPTKTNPTAGQQFATEDFIEAVIADVRSRHRINEKNIFTLSWSSSGPAAYAISLQSKTAVKGFFVVASVFRRHWLPPLAAAKGHCYYLLHSPQDNVCPFSHAQQAKADLIQAKATVHLQTYEGGHGWRGNVYGNIRTGISWLMEQSR